MTTTITALPHEQAPNRRQLAARTRRNPNIDARPTRRKVIVLIEVCGWTNSDITRISGVSRGSLYNLIHGGRRVTPAVAEAIAAIDPADRRAYKHRLGKKIEIPLAGGDHRHLEAVRHDAAQALEEQTAQRLDGRLVAHGDLTVVPAPAPAPAPPAAASPPHRRDPLVAELPTALPRRLNLLGGEYENWRDAAVCAQVDADIFFPPKGRANSEAKKLCRSCPVREQCLAHAVRNGEHHGIWGGASPREREQCRKQAGLPRVAPPRYLRRPDARS